jgi:hypothetical protein
VVFIFQINKGPVKRGQSFNGFTVIALSKSERKGNVQGKFRQGLRLGRCFLLSHNNIAEIRGQMKNDVLKVQNKYYLKL